MDPLTQALLGALAAQAVAKRSQQRIAALAGALAGMAPDLDIFISSAADPLVHIAYHRHFTHSLAFIPFGGALVTLGLWPFLRKKIALITLLLFCVLGYATHGLLDAFTSYGTRLLWPFSDARTSWNFIAVIDPIMTLLMLGGVIYATKHRSRRAAHVGLALAAFYMSFGAFQYYRAEKALLAHAQIQGHTPERFFIHPTLGNLVLWRGIYLEKQKLYAVAVRTPLSNPQIFPGGHADYIDPETSLPEIPQDSIQRNDLKRFAHFSAYFLAAHPEQPDLIGDFRYSLLPNSIAPMWGIRVSQQSPNEHVEFLNLREITPANRAAFFHLLFDGVAEFQEGADKIEKGLD